MATWTPTYQENQTTEIPLTLNQEIQAYVLGGAWKGNQDSEQSFLPSLINSYPNVSPKAITDAFYSLRQPFEQTVQGDQVLPQQTISTGGSGGGGGFQPVWFQGQKYSDVGSYQNALNASALDELNRNKSDLERMYQNGLISFQDKEDAIKQNREGIVKQRDTALQGNAGYFANISPDAYQSQQANYDTDVNKSYEQGSKQLDTAQERVGQAKTNFDIDYQNSLGDVQRNYQSNIDSYANSVADIQRSSRSIAPQQVTFDPVTTKAELNDYYNTARGSGFNPNQAKAYTTQYAQGQKVPQDQLDQWLNPQNQQQLAF